jgi:hypothetical protein
MDDGAIDPMTEEEPEGRKEPTTFEIPLVLPIPGMND